MAVEVETKVLVTTDENKFHIYISHSDTRDDQLVISQTWTERGMTQSSVFTIPLDEFDEAYCLIMDERAKKKEK